MCRFDYAVPNMQVPTAGVYQGICKTLYNKTLKYMTMQCTGLIRHWLIGRFPERPLPTSLPLPPSHSWVYLPPILLLATHTYMHAQCTRRWPILTQHSHVHLYKPFIHSCVQGARHWPILTLTLAMHAQGLPITRVSISLHSYIQQMILVKLKDDFISEYLKIRSSCISMKSFNDNIYHELITH